MRARACWRRTPQTIMSSLALARRFKNTKLSPLGSPRPADGDPAQQLSMDSRQKHAGMTKVVHRQFVSLKNAVFFPNRAQVLPSCVRSSTKISKDQALGITCSCFSILNFKTRKICSISAAGKLAVWRLRKVFRYLRLTTSTPLTGLLTFT